MRHGKTQFDQKFDNWVESNQYHPNPAQRYPSDAAMHQWEVLGDRDRLSYKDPARHLDIIAEDIYREFVYDEHFYNYYASRDRREFSHPDDVADWDRLSQYDSYENYCDEQLKGVDLAVVCSDLKRAVITAEGIAKGLFERGLSNTSQGNAYTIGYPALERGEFVDTTKTVQAAMEEILRYDMPKDVRDKVSGVVMVGHEPFIAEMAKRAGLDNREIPFYMQHLQPLNLSHALEVRSTVKPY